MAIHIRGVIRGQKIELESDPGLPNGTSVDVTIGSARMAPDQRRTELQKLFGVWRSDASIAQVFDDIAAARTDVPPRLADFDAAS